MPNPRAQKQNGRPLYEAFTEGLLPMLANAARGSVAATVGAPGDILGLLSDKQPLPTSQNILDFIPSVGKDKNIANMGETMGGFVPTPAVGGAMVRAAKTAANPATYRDAFYQAMAPGVMSNVRSQSKKGGEIAESNGYFYKGGQFLPSTEAEPGKWKIGKKWVTSGSELVEPGVIEKQPTPFSRSIFQMINQLLEKTDNGFKFRNDVRFTDGSPFSTESTIRPGVKGIVGTDEYTYQQLLDQYNAGNRWVNLNFDEPTLRTIQIVPEKKGLLSD
jgi:hypothetical protein